MAGYTLYCFAQSGNAYTAALMLELVDADWTPRFVDYFGGETRSASYRAINAMGEVPVLQDGALRLSQSGVILDYLAAKHHGFEPRERGFERRSGCGRLGLRLLPCGQLLRSARFRRCGLDGRHCLFIHSLELGHRRESLVQL